MPIVFYLHAALLRLAHHGQEALLRSRRRRDDERGQASAEYALVVLGAAFVAFLLVTWAQGSGKIGKLLDAVLERVTDLV